MPALSCAEPAGRRVAWTWRADAVAPRRSRPAGRHQVDAVPALAGCSTAARSAPDSSTQRSPASNGMMPPPYTISPGTRSAAGPSTKGPGPARQGPVHRLAALGLHRPNVARPGFLRPEQLERHGDHVRPVPDRWRRPAWARRARAAATPDGPARHPWPVPRHTGGRRHWPGRTASGSRGGPQAGGQGGQHGRGSLRRAGQEYEFGRKTRARHAEGPSGCGCGRAGCAACQVVQLFKRRERGGAQHGEGAGQQAEARCLTHELVVGSSQAPGPTSNKPVPRIPRDFLTCERRVAEGAAPAAVCCRSRRALPAMTCPADRRAKPGRAGSAPYP